MKEVTWGWFDLKYDLAEVIIPKLEDYKKGYIKDGIAIPSWLLPKEQESYSNEEIIELQEKWVIELDKMLLGFRQILNYKTGKDKNIGYDEEAIQMGLNSFAKHFQHFWD